MIQHNFQGCQIGIWPIGEEGKALVIVDPQTGNTYNFGMPNDVAADVGAQMRMGNAALAAKREEESRRAQTEAMFDPDGARAALAEMQRNGGSAN